MLEDRISTLTAAIEALTAAMNARNHVAPIPAPVGFVHDLPEPQDDPAPSNDMPSVSRDDLQAQCLALVRKDPSLKSDIKDLIAAAGGTIIRDVPEAKLQALKDALDNI